jgi:hypothetical protein
MLRVSDAGQRHDGQPDTETVKKAYDNLDFVRGVEAFLSGIPAASVYAACEGLSGAGVMRNSSIGIMEDLMDARSVFLTGNSTTVYVLMCLDLKDGPVVIEMPPGVLGPADDAYFRWVTDVGLTGPDKGEGGKYLFVRSARLHWRTAVQWLLRRQVAHLRQSGFLSRVRQRRQHRRRRERRKRKGSNLSIVCRW